MTTSEIRALLETLKDHYCAYLSMGRHVEKALALDRVIAAIETLLARQAEPAASPWRFDVENAPKDEWVAVWYDDHPRDWYKARLSFEGHWETVYYKETRTPTAFATINPPEVPNVLGE